MQIETEGYRVMVDESGHRVCFEGVLRLNGMQEYQPIQKILQMVAQTGHLIIDMEHLSFLNSSGIHMLARLVIEQRQHTHVEIELMGSTRIPWQAESFAGLRRLLPRLQITLK